MKVEITDNVCIVTRETGDPKFRNGGWATAETSFFTHVRKTLDAQGIHLFNTTMGREGHLMDDAQRILRPLKPRGTDALPEHNFGIYYGEYAIHDAAEVFNTQGKVVLLVTRPYWKTLPVSAPVL